MLTEIRIEGLGVIAEAAAGFDPGLTVVTGETGAGKTMVVTSLRLLSGSRADVGRVRVGADRAVVEGRFTTDSVIDSAAAAALEVVESAGSRPDDDGSFIAVRTVTTDGRSRAHLGGRSVPASVLADFTDQLLTVHGQNDQLRLRRPDQQRAALDRYAGPSVADTLRHYRSARSAWIDASSELAERTSRARELALEADRLQFAISEIDSVAPQPGEDLALVNGIRRLSQLDSLREAVATTLQAIEGGDESGAGAIELLATARTALENTEDAELVGLAERISESLTVVADIGAEAASYLSALPDDPTALDVMLQRQAELKSLIRKYAADADGVIAWADGARERLGHVDTSAEAVDELRARVSELESQVATSAAAVSKARRSAAKTLADRVSAELGGLAMGKARLSVTIRPAVAGSAAAHTVRVTGQKVVAGPDGIDDVEFELQSHPAAPALPLAKTASGGELSRVMLALELVLSASEKGTTMVFDEVDAGVGGRAAVEIGRRLARLARSHQVIVVTHLAQVAAFATTHLVVDKDMLTDRGAANSTLTALSRDARVAELARMLAGLGETETGRAHAEELLGLAQQALTESAEN